MNYNITPLKNIPFFKEKTFLFLVKEKNYFRKRRTFLFSRKSIPFFREKKHLQNENVILFTEIKKTSPVSMKKKLTLF